MELILSLYGSLRKYGDRISISAPQGISVQQLVTTLESKIDPQDLRGCAVGTDDRVLKSQDIVTAEMNLAMLPPVCGG